MREQRLLSGRAAARAFAIGWACGGRMTFGPAALALTSRRPVTGMRRKRSVGAALCGLGEVVVDKLPITPSRLRQPAFGVRIGAGAASAGSLAHREHEPPWIPIALGAAGTVAASYAGGAWRRWAVRRVPDWQAALAEDLLTGLVARYATRRGISERYSPSPVSGSTPSTTQASTSGGHSTPESTAK
jgi:uncharacterized membrane protein